MTKVHKLKLKNINGDMHIATLDGDLIGSVIRLDVTQEYSEITTATILVELHDDSGAKSVYAGPKRAIELEKE